MLFDGIRKQLAATNASLIKLDFAAFDCVSGAHTHAAGGVRSKEPAVRNLLSQLQTLRAEYPQLLVLAYNTFTVDAAVIAQLDETDSRAVVSAMWCLYLDYIYCGDPRPAEQIPAGLPQSLLAYTDAMEQRFLRAFVPPEAIDDHGTMIGNTNTIYYLGKSAFRDSWIMNLSHGNRKQNLYGELSLLDDADWDFLAQSVPLFERTIGENWTVQMHGEPMHGGGYAYSCFDEAGGFLTLVNPTDGTLPVLCRPHLSRTDARPHDARACPHASAGQRGTDYMAALRVRAPGRTFGHRQRRKLVLYRAGERAAHRPASDRRKRCAGPRLRNRCRCTQHLRRSGAAAYCAGLERLLVDAVRLQWRRDGLHPQRI